MLMSIAVVFYLATCTDGFLTSSQPTCIGDVIEYNCRYRDAALRWNYNHSLIHSYSSHTGFFEVKVNISEILFNLSFNTSGMIIMSTLRFKASEASNNLSIQCDGGTRSNTDTKVIEIIPPAIESHDIFSVRVIEGNLEVMWKTIARVDNYTISCGNDECNTQNFPGDVTEGNLTLNRNVDSLRLCVVANGICSSASSSYFILFTCVSTSTVTDTQEVTQEVVPDIIQAIRTRHIAGWLSTIAVVAAIAIAVVLLIILCYKRLRHD